MNLRKSFDFFAQYSTKYDETHNTYMDEVEVYCVDCRGRFEVAVDDIKEDEILECSLCGCELEVQQENPLKLKVVSDDSY